MRIDKQKFGLVLGPLVFIILQFFFHPGGLNPAAHAILASTVWIAIWWITEALPIAVTALMPLLLFPLTGGLALTKTATAYSNKFIFLFIGGFILAIALEKWHLHKRIALLILHAVGSSKKRIILGFMIATAFLSMWISNTATTVMMLPIGMALVSQLHQGDLSEANKDHTFGKALMLAIAYSASIGGIATIIGTPPNLILAGIVQKTFGTEITFFQWFSIGFPFAVLLLFICWHYLTRYAFTFKENRIPGGRAEISRQLADLGKMTFEEKMVLIIFSLTALAWMSRAYLIEPFFPVVDDTIIAILAAVTLFILPSGKTGQSLLKWEDAVKLPWGVLLLFGGGIAIAAGFESSGLAKWIGLQLNSLEGISIFLILLILVASVNFLTEITSNLATTAIILPILVPLALVINTNPYLLMAAATIAASCAFMLPVATPPNALVFGSGYLRISDMIKSGIWMNIFSIFLLTLLIYFLLPVLWGIHITPFPEVLRTAVKH